MVGVGFHGLVVAVWRVEEEDAVLVCSAAAGLRLGGVVDCFLFHVRMEGWRRSHLLDDIAEEEGALGGSRGVPGAGGHVFAELLGIEDQSLMVVTAVPLLLLKVVGEVLT
jgi:hypothetical protein